MAPTPFCPSCSEASPSPPGSTCETCGDTIIDSSLSLLLAQREEQERRLASMLSLNPSISLGPGEAGGGGLQNADTLRELTGIIASNISSELPPPPTASADGDEGGSWQQIPPGLLATPPPSHTPMSSSVLSRIPTLTLGPRSAVLQSSTATTPTGATYTTTSSPFGLPPPYTLTSPLTTSLADCVNKIVVVMRGQGSTFVEKARRAQLNGGVGCLIVQNVKVWP